MSLRLKAKALRARNKTLYYGLKYLAVVLVVAFIVWI